MPILWSCSVRNELILRGILLCGSLLVARPLAGQSVRGDSLAESLFRKLQPPGISIAVAGQDRILRWQLGSANLETGGHVERKTLFRVGSDSKLFTAAIAARLAARGRLDLDAPISRYLPDLPAAYRPLTARQLAGHLGGVRHYGAGEFASQLSYPSVSASLGVFLRDSLVAPPGVRYSYSSYGYNLLGAVLEAAGADSFDRLLRKEVAEPLQLRLTSLEPSGHLSKGQARPYSRDSSGQYRISPSVDLSDRWPSGGIVSTAEELARFALGLFSAGYLPDSLRSLWLEPQRTTAGTSTPVGLGWRIALDPRGRTYLHHGGSAMGGRAFLLVYPKERVAVAILANTEANFGESEALAFARLLLDP